MSLLIAVPTGIKIFNWIGTMWRGEVMFSTAMLFAIGFVITFLVGGLTGIYLASPPLDFFTHDTYFVVAHFHSVVLALVMGGMAGLYYWGPKITGYLLNERLGKIQFWMFFIGAKLFMMPQYLLGLLGMPRRVAIYPQHPEWQYAEPTGRRSARSSWASPRICLRGQRHLLLEGVPRRRQPLGRPDARVVHDVAAAAPQLLRLPPIRSERPTWDYNHPDGAAPHGTPRGSHASTRWSTT